jgi:D-glycero-alpha-D-manno-heptose 1-phosphate guanylyltransferase
MRAVVLAGGRGTRLLERVRDVPKPMAPVAGRPFLEYVLDGLISAGSTPICLSVGYMAEVVQSHFGARYRGTPIEYAVERSPLGTGGGIALALSDATAGPSLVVNGDTFLKVDFAKFADWYWQDPVPVAIMLRTVDDISRYGAVRLEGQTVVGFAEKGGSGRGLINAGVYVVRPEVFSKCGLSGAFSFETDLLARHLACLRVRAFVTDGYFIDIGVPEDFDRAQVEFAVER